MDKQAQNQPPNQRPIPKQALMKDHIINGKKVKVINLEELKRFAMRLGKISNFYFIGALVMFFAGTHFAQAGNVLLPKIFFGVLMFCLIMTLLSFRISYKVGKVVDIIGTKPPKK